MKKIYSYIVAVFAICLCSCNQSTSNDYASQIQYSLRVRGDADGRVNFLWQRGHLDFHGNANVDFSICSDTINDYTDYIIPLPEALSSNDVKLKTFGKEVAKQVADIQLVEAEGNYSIIIDGHAYDPKTGLAIKVYKVFENVKNK